MARRFSLHCSILPRPISSKTALPQQVLLRHDQCWNYSTTPPRIHSTNLHRFPPTSWKVFPLADPRQQNKPLATYLSPAPQVVQTVSLILEDVTLKMATAVWPFPTSVLYRSIHRRSAGGGRQHDRGNAVGLLLSCIQTACQIHDTCPG